MVRKSLLMVLILVMVSVCSFAQVAVKSSSVSGITGLIATPTARIGWEEAVVGFDISYAFLFLDGFSHVPAVSISFLNRGEFAFAVDVAHGGNLASAQPDMLASSKVQFYRVGSSAFAAGINYYATSTGGGGNLMWNHAMQIYFALTYDGEFFGWPSNTTIILGKTFDFAGIDGTLDFSMGFEMNVWPDVFKHYVHWIVEFSNYSYSPNPTGIDSERRGCFNTGLRIAPLLNDKFKLTFDIIGLDLFDEQPGVLAAMSFGVGVK